MAVLLHWNRNSVRNIPSFLPDFIQHLCHRIWHLCSPFHCPCTLTQSLFSGCLIFHKRHKRVMRESEEVAELEDSPSPLNLHNHSFVHRLPLPEGGGYHAPLQDLLTEPFVTNGSIIFSGMWSPTGARSPLVLLLVGKVSKSHNRHKIAWRRHTLILLLCVYLGKSQSLFICFVDDEYIGALLFPFTYFYQALITVDL